MLGSTGTKRGQSDGSKHNKAIQGLGLDFYVKGSSLRLALI
jgi:hypothetical protein